MRQDVDSPDGATLELWLKEPAADAPAGVPASRIRYEVFGPDLWMTAAS
jgi:hypothetical protein